MSTTEKKESESTKKLAALTKLSTGAEGLPLFDDKDYVTNAGTVSSGSISLDMALGGGYPRGSIIDTYGGESAGKSLLSIMAIAQVQKAGGVAVVWDAERSYSKNLAWLRTNGVDTTKLKFLRLKPTEGCEIGFDAVEKIAAAQAADLIVVDSIPALIPQESLDKDMTENDQIARRAGILTKALPRLCGICDESKTIVMFINQMRANIVGGPAAAFAPKTKETTVFSMKHFASLRLKVEKITKPNLKDGIPYSHRVRVVAVKNKVSLPYRTAEFDLIYTKGVDTAAEVADILIGAREADKKGAWIMYDGEKYQGRDAFVEACRNPKVADKYLKKAMSLADKINLFGVAEEEKKEAAGALSVSDSEE